MRLGAIIKIYRHFMRRRVNKDMKAILELPKMPRNCKNCPLKYYLDYSERNYPWEDYACITGKGIADKGRRPDCPLKLVEDKEGG